MGRQINDKIYYYNNYNLADENNNLLITETNLQLISELTNYNDKNEINNELIYKMSFFQNDSLLKSLMKQFNFEVHFELSIGQMVNAQFGVLVKGSYEYLDDGNYIIYSKKNNADNQTPKHFFKYHCNRLKEYKMEKIKKIS